MYFTCYQSLLLFCFNFCSTNPHCSNWFPLTAAAVESVVPCICIACHNINITLPWISSVAISGLSPLTSLVRWYRTVWFSQPLKVTLHWAKKCSYSNQNWSTYISFYPGANVHFGKFTILFHQDMVYPLHFILQNQRTHQNSSTHEQFKVDPLWIE